MRSPSWTSEQARAQAGKLGELGPTGTNKDLRRWREINRFWFLRSSTTTHRELGFTKEKLASFFLSLPCRPEGLKGGQ